MGSGRRRAPIAAASIAARNRSSRPAAGVGRRCRWLLNRQRTGQLVDRGEVGFGHREWFTDQPAEQVTPIADRNDQVADLGAVVAELRLIPGWRRGRVWHHLAATEVLHDQAKVVLWQPGRNLVAVRRIGSQRYARAGREVLHRGSRYIVVDDV